MVGLAKAAMAAGALALPEGFALADAAAPARQALEVSAHIDVPGGDLGRRGGTANGLHPLGLHPLGLHPLGLHALGLALSLGLQPRCGGLCRQHRATAEQGA